MWATFICFYQAKLASSIYLQEANSSQSIIMRYKLGFFFFTREEEMGGNEDKQKRQMEEKTFKTS